SWRRHDHTIHKGARVRFIPGMFPPADFDHLSSAALKSLVLKLLEEVAVLRRTVAAQRDEIARKRSLLRNDVVELERPVARGHPFGLRRGPLLAALVA